MLRHLGFFCSTADGKITTNRRIRLANLSFSRVLEVFEQNLADFKRLLDLSKELGCHIFRLGSNLVPFASHPQFKREWRKPIEERLRDFEKILKSYEIRITMHPGQYVVLNSPKREVIEASLRELEYHFWVLDCLGVDREGVVVIHGGGIYGDKHESLRRLKKILSQQNWLCDRLALENDERHFSVADLLPLTELGFPLVFDHYHHRLNPSDFKVDDLVKSWKDRVPEFHLSSTPSKPHRFGEHGDWLDPKDYLDLLSLFEDYTFDLIIEAKEKERAIVRLLRDLKEAELETEPFNLRGGV